MTIRKKVFYLVFVIFIFIWFLLFLFLFGFCYFYFYLFFIFIWFNCVRTACVQSHHNWDCAFGYLRLIPPCNMDCSNAAADATVDAVEATTTASILRENVITFFVVVFF